MPRLKLAMTGSLKYPPIISYHSSLQLLAASYSLFASPSDFR